MGAETRHRHADLHLLAIEATSHDGRSELACEQATRVGIEALPEPTDWLA